MRGVFQRFGRFALWIALVIFALNVEGVARYLGLDNVLAGNANVAQRIMKALLDFLQSKPALDAAIFLAGGGVFAWASLLIKKLENYGSLPRLHIVAGNCETAANCLDGYKISKWLGNIPKFLERTNKQLCALGMPRATIRDLDDKDERRRLAGYFGTLAFFLKRRDLDGARSVAEPIHARLIVPPTAHPAIPAQQHKPERTSR